MESKHKYLVAAGGSVLLIAIISGLFYPISQARLISAGVDTYSAHRPLFGSRELSQTISSPYPITGLGFILVDLRRANQLADPHITIRSLPDRAILLQRTIPSDSIRDDAFARLKFDTPFVTTNPVEIVISAPDATKENPIGVRTDPDAQILPYTMSENGVVKKGSLAIEVLEKVPAWRAFLNAANRYQNSWSKITISAAIVALIAMCAFYFPRPRWSAERTQIYQAVMLAIVVITAVAVRIPVIDSLHGVSGGDPYNYLLIAQSMARLESPFNEGEKRLPGYPLILVPTVLSSASDDHTYMRITSSLSAAGALIMIALLARAFSLPWPVQLIAPILIAWQKDFFATSLRPEPYTFYTFLLLASLVLFFSQRKAWQEILFGICLGWAALTRQEGFVLAALLGIAWFLPLNLQPGKGYKARAFSFLRMLLPALLINLPFFIHNTRLYGNPFTTPYFGGDRLQIVNSWEAFKDNLGSTWGVIGSLLRPSWEELERYNILGTSVLAGLLLTFLWWTLISYVPVKKKNLLAFSAMATATVFGVTFIALTLASKDIVVSLTPGFLAGIILISPIFFAIRTGPKGILVVAIALSQLLVATWFHPFAKHYQQILPLVGLMIAVCWITPAKKAGSGPGLMFTRAYVACAVVLLPIAWLTLITYSAINGMIDRQNAGAALDSVIYRAVKFAASQEGPYGSDQAYLAARLSFGHDGRYFYDDASTPPQETKWLQDNGVRTLITTNDGQTFLNPHPDWQELKRFRAEGKDEYIHESIVYSIPTP